MDDCDLRDLAAPYALGALDDGERTRFEAHLAGCGACAREVDAVRDSLLVLAHAAGAESPPPDLRNRIVAAVEREARQPEAAPEPRPVRRSLWRRRPLLTLAPALAVAAAAVAAVVLLTGGSGRPAPLQALGAHYATVALRGPGGLRAGSVYIGASGRAVARATLPAAPAGKVYEAWVMVGGRVDRAEPAGLFRGGAAKYVPLERRAHSGDVVGFTLERAGGSPRPTTPPLATARI